MTNDEIMCLLSAHNVKPTATRMLVLGALHRAENAVSLTEIEDELQTVDKSTIFRSLVLFRQNHLVHEIDDGSGSLKYEICFHDCAAEGDETDADEHAHFFCEVCHRIFCLKEIPAPKFTLPQGYELHSVNYVMKGCCPECHSKETQKH